MKDHDSQKITLYLRSLPYAIIGGGLVIGPGLIAGLKFWQVALLALGAFAIGLILPTMVSQSAADAGASLYHNSGKSTPPPAQYSLAESLVARGLNDEAEEAYTLLSEDFPLDPEPRIRLARFLRDKHQRYDDAATWFRSALSVQTIESAVEIGVTRELIEIYTHKLRTPEKALPWLKRLSEKYPQHPAAAWAQAEYAEIKNEMNAKRSS